MCNTYIFKALLDTCRPSVKTSYQHVILQLRTELKMDQSNNGLLMEYTSDAFGLDILVTYEMTNETAALNLK